MISADFFIAQKCLRLPYKKKAFTKKLFLLVIFWPILNILATVSLYMYILAPSLQIFAIFGSILANISNITMKYLPNIEEFTTHLHCTNIRIKYPTISFAMKHQYWLNNGFTLEISAIDWLLQTQLFSFAMKQLYSNVSLATS